MTLRVGPKNRIVLPVALRDAAGITIGSDLVGHVDEMGRLILETPAAVRARVWDAAPGVEGDSVADVAAARSADGEIGLEAIARRVATPFDEAAGERLLAELGL